MMIANTTDTVMSVSRNKTGGSFLTSQTANGFGPEYQVDLSCCAQEGGLALRDTASGVTESKMRSVLTRILLETLFGADKQPKDTETAEKELIREMILDPAVDTQMNKIARDVLV